jgi:SAM-dependent methyltransferase
VKRSTRTTATVPADVLAALDARYGLARKRAAEPDIDRVLREFVGRLRAAFGSLEAVRGKRILDIACGSNSSRSPDTGERTAVFEPWFCRLLLELGADSVGLDAGDLEGERFEHHRVDLSRIGALDFLPDASFDGIQDSRLFGSPEFLALLPRSQHAPIKAELRRQEKRLLKPGGVIIHSDNP